MIAAFLIVTMDVVVSVAVEVVVIAVVMVGYIDCCGTFGCN